MRHESQHHHPEPLLNKGSEEVTNASNGSHIQLLGSIRVGGRNAPHLCITDVGRGAGR